MTRRIIFHKSHMLSASANGKITIIRFLANARQRFEFDLPQWPMDDALAWGKRWVERVVY
jgi:hypothetical protein